MFCCFHDIRIHLLYKIYNNMPEIKINGVIETPMTEPELLGALTALGAFTPSATVPPDESALVSKLKSIIINVAGQDYLDSQLA